MAAPPPIVVPEVPDATGLPAGIQPGETVLLVQPDGSTIPAGSTATAGADTGHQLPDTTSPVDTAGAAAAAAQAVGTGTKATAKPEPNPLAGLEEADDIQWMLEDQAANGAYQLTRAQIDALPIESRQIVAALLHQGRAAAAQVEQLRAKLAQDATAAASDRAAAAKDNASALDWAVDDKLQQIIDGMKLKKGEVADHLSPEGITRMVEDRVAQGLQKWQDGIKAEREAKVRASQEAELVAKGQARKAEINKWAQQPLIKADLENPSFFTPFKSLVSKGIPLEEAYRLTKADLTTTALQAAKSKDLEDAQERLRRSPPGEAHIPEMPDAWRGNTEKEVEFYNRYPAAAKRDAERLQRQMG
jgi:hypothetical protein